jgi:hypothetical protein
MNDDPTPSLYLCYEHFLEADERRAGDVLECGTDWSGQGSARYRVCFYQQTGELTAERLSEEEPLDVEDFDRGVAGPVEILARLRNRAQLEAALGEWPALPLVRQRDISRLRELLRGRAPVS